MLKKVHQEMKLKDRKKHQKNHKSLKDQKYQKNQRHSQKSQNYRTHPRPLKSQTIALKCHPSKVKLNLANLETKKVHP